MPTRNPEAVRQRAIAAARQRTGQPATPTLDPVFVALNPGALPARERSPAELYAVGPPRRGVRHPGRQRGGRAEQRKPRPPAHHPRLGDHPPRPNAPTAAPATVKAVASAARPTGPPQPTAPADPTNPRSGGWWPMPADRTPPRRALDAGGQLVTHPYQGSAPGPVSAGWRLPPARTTYRWKPLETVANRSAPMACGPNVDQVEYLGSAQVTGGRVHRRPQNGRVMLRPQVLRLGSPMVTLAARRTPWPTPPRSPGAPR